MTALLSTLKKASNSWRSTVISSIKGAKSSKNMHPNSGNNFLPIASPQNIGVIRAQFHNKMMIHWSLVKTKATMTVKRVEQQRCELVGQVGGTPTHATVVVMVRPPSGGSIIVYGRVTALSDTEEDPPSCLGRRWSIHSPALKLLTRLRTLATSSLFRKSTAEWLLCSSKLKRWKSVIDNNILL